MSGTHEVAPDTKVGLDWDKESTRWEIIGDLRAPHSGMSDDANYMCRDALQPLMPYIEFDCETSCFYAYAKDRMHAMVLIQAIQGWLVSHRANRPADEDDEFS